MDSIAPVSRSSSGHISMALFVLALVLGAAQRASAHPMLQDRVELRVVDRARDVTIRSHLQTALAALGREPASGAFFQPDEVARAASDSVPYLLAHLHVEADGVVLAPRVLAAELETPVRAPVHRLADVERVFVVYRLRYEARRAPALLRIEQTMLDDRIDVSGRGGGRWVLDDVLEFTDARGETSMHLLRPGLPIELSTGSPSSAGRGSVFFDFLGLGATHILGGFDHLLFLAAVVLGATSVRSLVTIVLSFTLAHTTTLALATFGLVAIPSRVVEPLIGLSIVVAAAAALRAPNRRSTRVRASVAFAFGLVHGLGFAGGLSDALEGDRSHIALALIAFTIGVELVQQALVVPVYAGAAWLRRRPAGAVWVDRAALAVVVLGIVFFIQALQRAA
jgi:hypothetical protein